MPDEQGLSSEEHFELYQYLLSRLSERQLAAVRAEIEVAVTEPVFETSTPEEDIRISKIVRREVGKVSMRLRTSREMLTTALEIIRARVTELPTIADALARHLERSAEEIELRTDTPTP